MENIRVVLVLMSQHPRRRGTIEFRVWGDRERRTAKRYYSVDGNDLVVIAEHRVEGQ